MLKDVIKKVKKIIKPSKSIGKDTLYDYTDKGNREETVAYLLLYADGQRQPQVRKWRLYDDYYNNLHSTQVELMQYCQSKNIPWVPAIVPDPYIHVESQVNAEVPDFEFSGRDDDTDSQKAKIRQFVVQYVLDNNDMEMKNNRNERRLGKLGNEIWKIGFNYNLDLPNNVHGDIFVHDLDPINFVNDPIALDLDDGEYHDYVYKLHRIKAARVFKKELDNLGITVDQIGQGTFINTTLYTTETYDQNFDTVQIVEHWFRQPTEGSEKYTYTVDDKEVTETVQYEAGDIACSIQINNTEIKYIPMYWLKTHKQNKMYPFAIGCKIPIENQFWDKSEIEPIKELVDAADRELATVLLNDTFMGNDIILMPEGALADDTELINEPGAIWKTKQSVPEGAIKRLGGLGSGNNGLKDTLTYLREIIKQVVGNFDINMGGAPPTNVTTLGGLVQLKEQGNTRQNKKKVGVTAMWERLFKLIDYTALEFFDDNRLIYLGAKGEPQEELQDLQNQQGAMQVQQQIQGIQQNMQQQEQQMQNPQQQPGQPMQPPQQNMDRNKGPVSFKFNSDNIKSQDGYYPIVDCVIHVGDGITNSLALTIQATENISKMPITLENHKIVNSLIDLMKLPNRKEIKGYLNDYFANLVIGMPKTTINIKDLPPDGKVQLAKKIGIDIQPPEPMDSQGVPIAILAQNQPNVNGRVPLESQVQQQQPQQGISPQQQQLLNDLVSQAHVHLTPDELAHLQQHPEILQQIIQQYGGNQ